MKKRKFLRVSISAALALALTCCSRRRDAAVPSPVDYYTCTMHPSVHSKVPGKCPICSMDLVAVMRDTGTNLANESKSREFIVPVERQQQIGVTYAMVERKTLRRTLRVAGTVQPDISRLSHFTARVDGYVQKLHVKSPGEIVEEGMPLLSIYSPDLLTGERELLQLMRAHGTRDDNATLVAAAERRLKQWNLTDEQISTLKKSQTASDNLELLSPFPGVVQAVAVQPGASVKQGDLLVEIADFSVVWVWAEFYENEFSMLKQGQKTRLTCKAWPGERFEGRVSTLAPSFDETTRTIKARIDIANPASKLRPGMYGTVELEVDMGEGMVIPISAVMPTGLRNVVFVDKGDGRLEPRLVQLGRELDEDYEVLSGVSKGERVVSSANFLIDAESQVQGALKDFDAAPAAKPEGAQ